MDWSLFHSSFNGKKVPNSHWEIVLHFLHAFFVWLLLWPFRIIPLPLAAYDDLWYNINDEQNLHRCFFLVYFSRDNHFFSLLLVSMLSPNSCSTVSIGWREFVCRSGSSHAETVTFCNRSCKRHRYGIFIHHLFLMHDLNYGSAVPR